MKRIIFPLFLTIILSIALTTEAYSYAQGPRPWKANYSDLDEAPPPTCVPSSRPKKVQIVSYDTKIKVEKFLGTITECVTTMWDVLRILPGPNIINVAYPEEKEQWGYSWMWSYQLQNPIEDTIVLMDNPGKRIMKGKNPVELFIVFNENDVVERIEIDLIKKK